MLLKPDAEIFIEKSDYYKKYGICKIDRTSGFSKINFDPLEIANSLKDARKKLNKTMEYFDGEFLIVRYFEKGRKEDIDIKKVNLPAKKFAVFGFPDRHSIYSKIRENKVYYWGIIEGTDRNDAFTKLKFKEYWYHVLSRDLFLYELKDGKLTKNHFPGIPILSPYDIRYKGGIIDGVKKVPLKDILPGDLNVKPT